MKKRTKLAWSDALLSAAAVAIVLIVIVASDVRVREHAERLVGTASSYSVSSASAEVRDFGRVLFLSVKERSLDHGPIVIFATTAAVLVLCMARS